MSKEYVKSYTNPNIIKASQIIGSGAEIILGAEQYNLVQFKSQTAQFNDPCWINTDTKATNLNISLENKEVDYMTIRHLTTNFITSENTAIEITPIVKIDELQGLTGDDVKISKAKIDQITTNSLKFIDNLAQYFEITQTAAYVQFSKAIKSSIAYIDQIKTDSFKLYDITHDYQTDITQNATQLMFSKNLKTDEIQVDFIKSPNDIVIGELTDTKLLTINRSMYLPKGFETPSVKNMQGTRGQPDSGLLLHTNHEMVISTEQAEPMYYDCNILLDSANEIDFKAAGWIQSDCSHNYQRAAIDYNITSQEINLIGQVYATEPVFKEKIIINSTQDYWPFDYGSPQIIMKDKNVQKVSMTYLNGNGFQLFSDIITLSTTETSGQLSLLSWRTGIYSRYWPVKQQGTTVERDMWDWMNSVDSEQITQNNRLDALEAGQPNIVLLANKREMCWNPIPGQIIMFYKKTSKAIKYLEDQVSMILGVNYINDDPDLYAQRNALLKPKMDAAGLSDPMPDSKPDGVNTQPSGIKCYLSCATTQSIKTNIEDLTQTLTYPTAIVYSGDVDYTQFCEGMIILLNYNVSGTSQVYNLTGDYDLVQINNNSAYVGGNAYGEFDYAYYDQQFPRPGAPDITFGINYYNGVYAMFVVVKKKNVGYHYNPYSSPSLMYQYGWYLKHQVLMFNFHSQNIQTNLSLLTNNITKIVSVPVIYNVQFNYAVEIQDI